MDGVTLLENERFLQMVLHTSKLTYLQQSLKARLMRVGEHATHTQSVYV